MSGNPPPDVAAAAAKVEAWLQGQPPQKATDAEFKAMSPAQKLDYARQFSQPTSNGRDGRI